MKTLIASVFCTLALTLGASASATVLDFEDLAGRPYFTPLPANYAGVTWAANFWAYDHAQFPYTAHSGIVRLANNGSQAGDSSFSFAQAVQFDGAWAAGNGALSFSLYNAGMLVATSNTLSLSGMPTFLSSGYTGLVDRVVVNGTTGQFGLDDVQFEATNTNVPEPGVALLFGLGMAGLAGARHIAAKRRRA
jgi:hypothetical protein